MAERIGVSVEISSKLWSWIIKIGQGVLYVDILARPRSPLEKRLQASVIRYERETVRSRVNSPKLALALWARKSAG